MAGSTYTLKPFNTVLSFLNSKDCVHWGLLPTATKAMRDQSKLAKGRFIGDPSFEFEHVETKKVGEGEDATEEEETVSRNLFTREYLVIILLILHKIYVVTPSSEPSH